MTSLVVKELKKQFSNDLLYIYLKNEGFKEEELFPSFLNQISIERFYSTLEVARLFETNDNNLRYQMKIMRRLGYIDSFKAGRNHRFNYLNIYRMFLVGTILNLPGRNTGDIANILKGKNSEVVVEKKIQEPEEFNAVKNELAKMIDTSINDLEVKILDKQILINDLQMNINELYKSYLQLDHNFNLSVLESNIFGKVNEAVKQANKKWFLRSTEQEAYSSDKEPGNHLRGLKDEINTLQSDIKEYEKSLAIERHELRKLFDEKRRLLKLG